MGDVRGRSSHPLGWRKGTQKRATGDFSRIINVYQVEHDTYKDAYLKIPNTKTEFMEISVVENLTTSLGYKGVRATIALHRGEPPRRATRRSGVSPAPGFRA